MSEAICPYCGRAGPAQALYCPHCGRALVPLQTRLTLAASRLLDNLTSWHIGILGLAGLVAIGLLIHQLVVGVGLYLAWSYVLLALGVGSGGAYQGWHWGRPLSSRARLWRLLLALVGVGALVVCVLLIEGAILPTLAESGQRVVLDIPGVHLEAHLEALDDRAPGLVQRYRRLRVISDPPPYWLMTMIYALLAAVAGVWARRLYDRLMVRERDVRDLRENLLARVHDTAVQQERNRLARELHDSIKQQIFSVSMSAAAAEARWESDPPGAREALGDVRRSAQEAMTEMNALLQQLSPAPLEKVGLLQALRDQCEALGYRTDAQVAVEFGALPAEDRLPAGTQESLFRITQEAFSNIARHARAGHVRLYLGQRDADGAPCNGAPLHGALTLEVQDDGRGFQVAAVGGGMGLENIRQRVSVLGGQLVIESKPGKGTTLRVTIPLSKLLLPEKEMRQNHTLNRALLAGLGGGVALIAALFYPLYVLAPGGYVDGWLVGSETIGLALEIAAVLLAVATGWLAARWARPGARSVGALFGALAGGVAGTVLYLGIGGAAANVVGNSVGYNAPLMQHGLVTAAGETETLRLLIEALIGIVWWSHGTFWVALLTGTGLGALGGLLAPLAVPSSSPKGMLQGYQTSLRPVVTMILAAGALTSTFTLILTVVVFALLGSTVHDRIVERGLSLATMLAPEGVSLWPIGTAMIFYLASLAALYYSLRLEITPDPSRLAAAASSLDGLHRLYPTQSTAAVFGLVSFGVPAYFIILGPDLIRPMSALGAAIVITVTSSLALGSLYLLTFVEVRQRRLALGLCRPNPVRMAAAIGVLLSGGIVVWAVTLPPFFGLLAGLIVIVIDVTLFVLLRRQPKPSQPDAVTLAQIQASMSQFINGGLGIMAAMIVPSAAAISAATGIIMFPVRFVEALIGNQVVGRAGIPAQALVELVREAYLAQARVSLAVFAGAVVVIGLLTLLMSGIMVFARRRA